MKPMWWRWASAATGALLAAFGLGMWAGELARARVVEGELAASKQARETARNETHGLRVELASARDEAERLRTRLAELERDDEEARSSNAEPVAEEAIVAPQTAPTTATVVRAKAERDELNGALDVVAAGNEEARAAAIWPSARDPGDFTGTSRRRGHRRTSTGRSPWPRLTPPRRAPGERSGSLSAFAASAGARRGWCCGRSTG